MRPLGTLLHGLTRIASLLGTLSVVLMMLHVTADVVGRYFFNAPLPGTIAIVGHYYMIAIVFFVLGVAEEQKMHISVEFITDMLPRTVQGWLEVLSFLITAVVFTLMAWRGFEEAVKKTKIGAAMENGSAMIPVWQSYWAIPLGGGLIVLIALYRVLLRLTGGQSGLTEAPETEENFHD